MSNNDFWPWCPNPLLGYWFRVSSKGGVGGYIPRKKDWSNHYLDTFCDGHYIDTYFLLLFLQWILPESMTAWARYHQPTRTQENKRNAIVGNTVGIKARNPQTNTNAKGNMNTRKALESTRANQNTKTQRKTVADDWIMYCDSPYIKTDGGRKNIQQMTVINYYFVIYFL